MIRLAILSSSLFLTLSLTAQHRTDVNQDGERLSERTDINGNKQGDFIFYDYQDQIIRIDNYVDGKLIKRECHIQDKGFEDHSESIIYVLIGDKNAIEKIREISNQSHGEIHIKADGTCQVYFYNEITNIQKSSSVLSKIISLKNFSAFTILTF